MSNRLFVNTPAPSMHYLYHAFCDFNLHVRGDAAFFALSVRSGAPSNGWSLNSAVSCIEHLSVDLQARIISAVIKAEVDQRDLGKHSSHAQYAKARADYTKEAHGLVVAALRSISKNDIADALAEYAF